MVPCESTIHVIHAGNNINKDDLINVTVLFNFLKIRNIKYNASSFFGIFIFTSFSLFI